MENHNRDLLVLLKADTYNEDLLHSQVECLHKILLSVESDDVFCTAHELARRTRITTKSRIILKAIQASQLKPFHFLINRN